METDSNLPELEVKRSRRPQIGLENRGQRETAQYIADMSLELRNLAKHQKMLTLQGLLEVTFYEAFSVANKAEIPENEIEHLKTLSRASTG